MRPHFFLKFMLIAAMAVAAAIPLLAKPAAATLLVIQQWEDLGFASNGRTVRTGARFDDSSFTGIGVERSLLFQLNVIRLTFDVAQSSEIAIFPAPPSFASDGSIFAEFNAGIFQGLFSVDVGLASRTTLVEEVTGFDNGNRVILGGGRLTYFVGLDDFRYDLVSSEFFNLTAVPEPASGMLFGIGSFWLIARRRRKTA